jgi:hypothetical protein
MEPMPTISPPEGVTYVPGVSVTYLPEASLGGPYMASLSARAAKRRLRRMWASGELPQTRPSRH